MRKREGKEGKRQENNRKIKKGKRKTNIQQSKKGFPYVFSSFLRLPFIVQFDFPNVTRYFRSWQQKYISVWCNMHVFRPLRVNPPKRQIKKVEQKILSPSLFRKKDVAIIFDLEESINIVWRALSPRKICPHIVATGKTKVKDIASVKERKKEIVAIVIAKQS